MGLYQDQERWVADVRQAMRRDKFVLGQAFTGFGKTKCSSHIIRAAIEKGSRVIMTFPRRELLAQTMESFSNDGMSFGVISQGYTPNPLAKLQLATIDSLARRLDKVQPPNLLIPDETHFGAGSLEKVIHWAKYAGSWGLGLSATPLKMNGKPLGDWYDAMVLGPSPADLIAAGRLSDFRYFAPSTPDLSGVRVSNGEYVQSQLAEVMEGQSVLIGDMVKHWRNLASGKITVGFAVSRKHCQMMAAAFNAAGIPSAAIDGTMDDTTRRRIVRALATREIFVLWSVQLLQLGFDLAQAAGLPVTVEAMIDAQPMKSLPMQMQKIGRVLRAKTYPAIILDHAGNCATHGFPDQEREWSLTGDDSKKRGASERTEKTRQCEIATGGCGFVARLGPPVCPECGKAYPVQSRMVEEKEGELAEIDRHAQVIARKQEQGRADSLEALREIAKREGRNPRWADHVWAARQRKRGAA